MFVYFQSYVQALTNPDGKKEVSIPASLIKTLGRLSREHFKLESEYGVVIRYPQDTKAVIAGNAMNTTLAASKMDDLINKYSSNSTSAMKLSNAKVSQANSSPPRSSPPRANRVLEDFALKLGYEQEQINMVFEKLGPTPDQNTFLNELIKLSGARSRQPDDRWMPVSPQANGVSRQDPYIRHPNSSMNSPGYTTDSVVMARGAMPRSSVNNQVSNAPQSYPNMPVGSGINPYGQDLGMAVHNNMVNARGLLPRQGNTASGSNVVPRCFMPRTTSPSSHGSVLSQSNAMSPGLLPRTTSQTTQGSSSTYSSSDWSNNPYLGQGSDYMLNADPQQVDRMVEQMTSKYQQLPQSDLRHIVIDGSNVAMR